MKKVKINDIEVYYGSVEELKNSGADPMGTYKMDEDFIGTTISGGSDPEEMFLNSNRDDEEIYDYLMHEALEKLVNKLLSKYDEGEEVSMPLSDQEVTDNFDKYLRIYKMLGLPKTPVMESIRKRFESVWRSCEYIIIKDGDVSDKEIDELLKKELG